MLKATHTNSFSRIAQKGAMKGRRIRIHTYRVTGLAKEMAAYNAAQEKSLLEKGYDLTTVAKDDAGNYLFTQIPNWQTGNLAKPELDLKITFNGYVTVDNEVARMANEEKRFTMKEEHIARIAAEIELGVTTVVATNAPLETNQPAAPAGGNAASEPEEKDELDKEMEELQKEAIGIKNKAGEGNEDLGDNVVNEKKEVVTGP